MRRLLVLGGVAGVALLACTAHANTTEDDCTPAALVGNKKFDAGTCWTACASEFGETTVYAVEHHCDPRGEGCQCCCNLRRDPTVERASSSGGFGGGGESVTVTVTEALERGVAKHRLGDLGGAQELYEAVTAGDPGNADAWHLLGLVHHTRHEGLIEQRGGQRDPEEQALSDLAARFVSQAWRLAPDRLDIGVNAGEVLRKAGQLDDASSTLRAVLAVAARAGAEADAAAVGAEAGAGEPSRSSGGGGEMAAKALFNLVLVEADRAGDGRTSSALEEGLRSYLALAHDLGFPCEDDEGGGPVAVATGMLGDALRSRGAFAEAVAVANLAEARSKERGSEDGVGGGGYHCGRVFFALQRGVARHQGGDLRGAAVDYQIAVRAGEERIAALAAREYRLSLEGSGGSEGSGRGGEGEGAPGKALLATLARQVRTAQANGAVVLHEAGDVKAAAGMYTALIEQLHAEAGRLRAAGANDGPVLAEAVNVGNNLGAALLAGGRNEEGVHALTAAVALAEALDARGRTHTHADGPGGGESGGSGGNGGGSGGGGGCADCHVNLAGHWAEEGLAERAAAHYAEALRIKPDEHGLHLRVATSLPAIPSGAGGLAVGRSRFRSRVLGLLFASRRATAAAAASSAASSASTATGSNMSGDGERLKLVVPLVRAVSSVERMHFYIQWVSHFVYSSPQWCHTLSSMRLLLTTLFCNVRRVSIRYAGLNDRLLQTSAARLFAEACPELLRPEIGAHTERRFGVSPVLLPWLAQNSVADAGWATAAAAAANNPAKPQASPPLAFKLTAPSVPAAVPVRLGFLSKFFGDDEPHGELLEGIVHALARLRVSPAPPPFPSSTVSPLETSPEAAVPSAATATTTVRPVKLFTTVVLHVAAPGRSVSKVLAVAADEVVELSLNWLGTRAAVAAANLDVLVFADSVRLLRGDGEREREGVCVCAGEREGEGEGRGRGGATGSANMPTTIASLACFSLTLFLLFSCASCTP